MITSAQRRPVFDHLERLTDERGLFEHALGSQPRPEHGYCLDDVARALVVVCREPQPDARLHRLAHGYLDFTLAAVQSDGTCHNRMNIEGQWTDDPSLGVAAAQAPTPAMRARALLGFRTAAGNRSPFLRAMAFAALGAGEVLGIRAEETSARSLLTDAATMVGGAFAGSAAARRERGEAGRFGAGSTLAGSSGITARGAAARGAASRWAGSVGSGSGRAGPHESTMTAPWPWPEERLTYGNGSIVEALLVAGATLPDPAAHALGLELLDFLLRTQIRQGHLSVIPVGGRGPRDPIPGFDQQPIEVAALADVCARAWQLTAEPRWLDGVRLAWAWFLGENDSRTPMADLTNGAGFDGLQRIGRNRNQGAESTLAMLSTAQQAHALGVIE